MTESISLYSTPVGGGPSFFPHHQSWVYVDSAGDWHILMGSPTDPSPPQKLSAIGESLNAVEYGTPSPYGPLKVDSFDLTASQVAGLRDGSISTSTLSSDLQPLFKDTATIRTPVMDADLSAVWEKMSISAETIAAAEVPYSPLANNCGSFATTIARAGGVEVPSSGFRSQWTPGWDKPISLTGPSEGSGLQGVKEAAGEIRLFGLGMIAYAVTSTTNRIESQIENKDYVGAASTINNFAAELGSVLIS